MKKDELDRFVQTLKMHAMMPNGKNDLVVSDLLDLAEFEQLERD